MINKCINRFNNDINSFSGIKITKSMSCLEKTEEPKRIHKNKNKLSYHLRIQKKWNKKFGYVMKPVMYKTPYGFICHPSLYNNIVNAITNGQMK